MDAVHEYADAGEARVILAVDGNSLVHRSFHAQAGTGFRGPDGRPMWAVRGLLSQLVAAVERTGAGAVVVGFDDPHASRRRDTWPQYKATRTDKLDTMVGQLAGAIDPLRAMGVAVVVPDGLEADDVLASTARYAASIGASTVVMTSDRDAFCLIDGCTRVLRIINGGVEASPLLTPDRLVTLLGVRPEQYRDFAALRGDASDNLPGVRGVGPKTAARLLATLGSARAAFDDVAAGGGRVTAAIGTTAATKLADPAARAAWALNCQVMRMHDDIPLGCDLRAGAGTLPLAADAVRAAFGVLQLPLTTATALRVLAHQDSPAPAPRIAWRADPDRSTWPPRRSQPPSTRRTTRRLAAAASIADTGQLPLF
ncbi:MAG: 5'-3' exonuclease [Mycobacteriales bacterium]